MKLKFLLVLALTSGLAGSLPAAQTETKGPFNVRDFGAVGDGTTKDTAAFQKALDACQAAGGGTVSVPGGTYLIGSIVIGNNTKLQLSNRIRLIGSADLKDYPVERVRWEGEFREGHRALISASHAGNVEITGGGFIFGPPFALSRLRDPRGPALLEFNECTNVTLEGFTTRYQRLWSIHPVLCRHFVARNLIVRSVDFNGDGIDVDSCSDVLIENCSIDTGDDAVALKSGRGMEAVRLGRPTEHVVIKNSSLISSIFAGLAFGSELSGGIRDVDVENCLISGRQNGIFFKSRGGRGGFIEDVTGKNLLVYNSPTFVAISLLNKGIQSSEPVSGKTAQWTEMKNVHFEHIQVHDVSELVEARNVPAERLVENLSFADISGDCGRAFILANMTNVVLTNIHVTGYEGPLVTTKNVRGSGWAVSK